MNFTKHKYMGTALPGNAEVVTLLEVADNSHQGHCRYILSLFNSQSGTVAAQFYDETAATWRPIIAGAATSAASTAANVFQVLVAPYQRWRVIWTNGATPQTIFQVNQITLDEVLTVP